MGQLKVVSHIAPDTFLILLHLLFILNGHTVLGMPATNIPSSYTQPNGSNTGPLWLHGDADVNWLLDMQKYMVIQDEGGWYYYARKEVDGKLVSSGVLIGKGMDHTKLGLTLLIWKNCGRNKKRAAIVSGCDMGGDTDFNGENDSRESLERNRVYEKRYWRQKEEGVVSVLDLLLGTALDHPTHSPASPIVSRNEHSEAVQISMSMPVLSNNTHALHCPSTTAMQEPSKPLW
jgi:hypothetical protein